ncbi:DUF6030 family protein [Ensifer soli]|uniref:DUF6030 family protein n=1 Tax=Ciceribacter sp. sgz301302 TaxID=3342379 RepID=UPI0035B883F4
MNRKTGSRAGVGFFLAVTAAVFAGIAATFLLANDLKNLRVVAARLGYPLPETRPIPAEAPVSALPEPQRHREPQQVLLPASLLADMNAPAQAFTRMIRKDPEALCRSLSGLGLGAMSWSTSPFDHTSWECYALREQGQPLEEDKAPSSIFVALRGDGENRAASFRFKLNIEDPADRTRLTDEAATVAATMLGILGWQDDGTMERRIRALEPFDIRQFGSRAQFKREFGPAERYNFHLSRDRQTAKRSDFFDPDRWLPVAFDAPPTPGHVRQAPPRDVSKVVKGGRLGPATRPLEDREASSIASRDAGAGGDDRDPERR